MVRLKNNNIEHKDEATWHQDYIKWFEKLKSFVYGECTFEQVGNNPAIIVEVAARKNARGLSPSYDKQP